ncbi:MAG: transcription-repair coupling factor [Acidobacteriota bacterium]|nr:transcription-repair coupling factor [Acidobacteriota bacterium]
MDDRVWGEYARTLRASAPYRALRKELGDVVRLPLPAAAWVGGLLSEDLGRPLLVVVPREADGLAWVEAADLFHGPGTAVYFPAPSLSPYQEAETSLPVRAQESVALDRALAGEGVTVVCTPRALFRRLPSAQDFLATAVELEPGEEYPIDVLLEHLVSFGYRRSDLVMEMGEIAVRGGVVDLFPPGAEQPVRLDLFGDTLESIRSFDATTQRSEEVLPNLRILPLSLFPAGEEQARELGRQLAEQAGPRPSRDVAERLQHLSGRGGFAGWENYLPLLVEKTQGLAQLLGNTLVVTVDPVALAEEAEHHAETLQEEHRVRAAGERLAIAPEALELPADAVLETLAGAGLRVHGLVLGEQTGVDFEGSITDVFHSQLPRFPNEVETTHLRGETPLVVVGAQRRRQLVELLEGRELEIGATGSTRGLQLAEGELQRGFRLPAAKLSLYSEHQLFGRLAPAARSSKARFGPFVNSLRDLKVGDYVVHADHGIGQFVSLRAVEGEGGIEPNLPPVLAEGRSAAASVEVMQINYASGKTLLLPLSRLDQVQKYGGIEGVAPRLDTLGGTSWARTKKRVKKSLRDMAGELLKLYAQRELAEAPAMPADSDLVHQFEAAFEFDETPDQLEAISTIKQDLESRRPMDRLLCGDVGYGKTEVAMRAAFKAVDGGYQVAVLAPTTILADQHLETFKKRFAGFPVSIEMISRFRSPAQVKEIGEKLAAGKLDVLIGTHRLLSRGLKFSRLGLLIVDEEQRFGVAQKERLKQLKKDVHVLAMSATPVPRTLQLSLAGVRELSVIETPPKDRMAVETAILPFSAELIREALEFELERGGQIYFVHNRVETIENMQGYLREIVPRARITVGHGQLDEQELARRMHAFTDGKYDVLLATTIIENGIDIPNVNTMIVHRADRFGLAQLYQLRGRVGRSNQLAYCYLLVPGDKILSETARKRLAAIREFSDLGAGFRIAARDLEIRGAGNLLGAEQSGHIAAVGIETYLKMLDETVRELRGEKIEEGPSVTLDLPVAMSIPETYVSDANLRMEIYRKIAAAEESDDELQQELADRFGAPPASVRSLIRVGAIKRQAEALRVQSISAHRGKLVLRLRQDARIDLDRLIEMVSEQEGATFSPTGALTLRAESGEDPLLDQIAGLIQELAAPTGEEAPQQAAAAPQPAVGGAS